MNNMKAKLRKSGGFTLIEMLIVVAIIAILIAISIPLVGSALENARESTDAANERAFKADLLIYYLSKEKVDATTEFAAGTVYAYDAANGKVVAAASKPDAGYGQGTASGKDTNPKDKGILYGGVGADGTVKMCWVTTGTAPAKVEDITENLTGPYLTGAKTATP